ncbi:hypothetical protein EDB82DRAFT_15874 [Fusarium venenatum]|uniref:uncharacterized protein n=1 Tax=Fusarium venenatum TaxID=56646 RepID=UPI001D6060B4|nr:hypothetical protein EDB82DRAFT_15874 [Fusarium venenatum]
MEHSHSHSDSLSILLFVLTTPFSCGSWYLPKCQPVTGSRIPTLKMTGWGDRGKNFRGNVARLHEKLYHLPPVSYVVDVGPVACFSTIATASDSSVGDRHPVSLQEAVSAALINISSSRFVRIRKLLF